LFSTLSGTSPIAALIPRLYQSGYTDEEIQEFIDLLEKQDPDAFQSLNGQQPTDDTPTES
jgi:succinate dehydrogenase flavin-adding protein (antitoxin of CptAB toxin-antitoxin module)